MKKIYALFIGMMLSISLPAIAGNGHGNSGNHGQESNHGNNHHNDDYDWNDFHSQICSGNKPLPPGIKKNLVKGKPLPPGIAKRHVPAGILSTLPRHAGQEWNLIGSDFVSVVITSGIVGEIIHNSCN